MIIKIILRIYGIKNVYVSQCYSFKRKKNHGEQLKKHSDIKYTYKKRRKISNLIFGRLGGYLSLDFNIYVKANKKQLGLDRSQNSGKWKHEVQKEGPMIDFSKASKKKDCSCRWGREKLYPGFSVPGTGLVSKSGRSPPRLSSMHRSGRGTQKIKRMAHFQEAVGATVKLREYTPCSPHTRSWSRKSSSTPWWVTKKEHTQHQIKEKGCIATRIHKSCP